MRTRVYCRKHNRTHSQHANYHCKIGHCTKRGSSFTDLAGKCTMIRDKEGKIR